MSRHEYEIKGRFDSRCAHVLHRWCCFAQSPFRCWKGHLLLWAYPVGRPLEGDRDSLLLLHRREGRPWLGVISNWSFVVHAAGSMHCRSFACDPPFLPLYLHSNLRHQLNQLRGDTALFISCTVMVPGSEPDSPIGPCIAGLGFISCFECRPTSLPNPGV